MDTPAPSTRVLDSAAYVGRIRDTVEACLTSPLREGIAQQAMPAMQDTYTGLINRTPEGPAGTDGDPGPVDPHLWREFVRYAENPAYCSLSTELYALSHTGAVALSDQAKRSIQRTVEGFIAHHMGELRRQEPAPSHRAAALHAPDTPSRWVVGGERPTPRLGSQPPARPASFQGPALDVPPPGASTVPNSVSSREGSPASSSTDPPRRPGKRQRQAAGPPTRAASTRKGAPRRGT